MKTLLLLVCLTSPSFLLGAEPISKSEYSQACSKVEKCVRSVLKEGASTFVMDKTPGKAKRSDFINFLSKLQKLAEPHVKRTPPKMKFEPKKVKVGAQLLGKVRVLVEGGFLARVGPIITRDSEDLVLDEFGDALGLFLARIADLTHVPRSKFSPAMMDGG